MTEDFNLDVDAILKEIETLASERIEADRELKKIRDDLITAQELVNKLASQRDNLVNKRARTVNRQRELERQREKAERFKAAEEKRNALIKQYEEKAKELDNLTATAAWREFAFDHQITGGKRLAVAERGLLGDKRGLGKTLTSLIYLDMVQARKVLVIAPNDVVPQFEQEINHWASHRSILSFAGLNKSQRSIIYPMLKELDSFIITLNYEAWRRDKGVIDDLASAGIDTIILDEAHRIKSSNKQTARGIFQIVFARNYCSQCDSLVPVEKWYEDATFNHIDPMMHRDCPSCGNALQQSVKNVLGMTGTPILNKPQELFSMLHIIDPYRFPSERNFLNDYCYLAAPNRWRFRTGGLERLTESMSEFFVQRTREDAGITIPPPQVIVHSIEPDPVNYPNQYKAYKDLTEAAALMLESTGETVSILYLMEIILRERQIITWPAGVELKIKDEDNVVVKILRFDVEESQKLDEVTTLLLDLAEEGERFVCFSKFKAPLYELKRRLTNAGYKVTTATGDDPKYHKDSVREDFDLKTAPEKPKWVGVFATYDAFATGVNLNAARQAILVDSEWSPGMRDQAIGRIDRLNSVDQATVHIFEVNKTVDVFMRKLLEEKSKITDGFEDNFSAREVFNHLKDVL